ncbi:MAG: hypothetical protein ACOCWA_03965 [Bacteroidota bacterium]
MKRIILKKLLTTYLIIFSGLIVLGQNGSENPGDNQAEKVHCELELSNMAEFMKIDLPDYAYSAWKKVFEHCPDASKNIYISGSKIYADKLRKVEDPQRKQELFDTLMLIYDRRIEYFGEEGYVMGRKGMDIIRFNEQEFEKAYEAFSKSTELLGEETDLNVVTGLIQTGSVMLKGEKISPSEFLEDYMAAMNIIDMKGEAGQNPAKLKRVQAAMDKILSNTRISDCEAIENALADKVNAPDVEGDFLRLSLDLLTLSGCDNTGFYADVNEKLMEVAPDPDLAYRVAKYNLKNENFEKAAEFLRKAIDNEEDQEQKALYEYQLSVIELNRLGNPQTAKDLAMKAADHKEGWGEPYIIAANAILEGIKNCNLDKFDKQAAYWLATDYLEKAKQLEPGIANKVNDLIVQYRSNYPSVEETFFRSLNEGDSFSIGCWINETTTVKSKK